MANTLITPDSVAKMGLIALLNNWVFAGLVHKDYSEEFRHVGDTVRVKKPITVTAIEFDGDLTGQFQNVTEEYINVVMDTILTVPLQVTAKELSLDVMDFNNQFVVPACQALADKVDEKIALLYKDVEYYQDASSTTAVSDITGLRKIMSDNKAPQRNRYGVLSPLTFATLLNLSEFRDLEKTGETAVLKEASLGRRFGFELYESQNIQHHTIGTTDEAVALNGDHAADATSLVLSGCGTGTINQGTILTFTGYSTERQVVTADATISGNAATVTVSPGLSQAIVDTTVITLHGDDANTASKENLFFHKNAFGMISAPLEPPLGGAKGASIAYNGLSLNVVYDYEMAQFKNLMTLSILCGFKTLQSELAVRLYDAS